MLAVSAAVTYALIEILGAGIVSGRKAGGRSPI